MDVNKEVRTTEVDDCLSYELLLKCLEALAKEYGVKHE
jgi:hypothetical protein